jgi:hypothetical protein
VGSPDIAHGGASSAPRGQVRDTIRGSYRADETYFHRIRRYILFHDKRHPRDTAASAVTALLDHLARDRDVAGSPQTRRCPRVRFSTTMYWFSRLTELRPKKRAAKTARAFSAARRH